MHKTRIPPVHVLCFLGKPARILNLRGREERGDEGNSYFGLPITVGVEVMRYIFDFVSDIGDFSF